ncbi:hypothetical protein CK203_066295 [Vitis vinifera]|uniref:Retrotransposon gag domain-containing protein n=1 Tax=Vitis vinifera TaxID=29760 RepID=A0A438FNR1_VITVI|nr:hypothetical protein CK203_066295 [Vitis vinifera]
MPNIERYTSIGYPRIHLRLYSTVMRAHGLDESQMITLFPLSLSGAAQCWFTSLESSQSRTWDDLAQEFLQQFSFNTVVNVSRRELKALRQRADDPGLPGTWSGYPSQISIIWSWLYTMSRTVFPEDSGQILPLVMLRGRSPPRDRDRLMPQAPHPTYDQTYMPQTLALPYYAPRASRDHLFHIQPHDSHNAEAVFTVRHAVELGSSEAYRGWGPGHETDRCTALRHAIQDLINQGLVHLGQSSVTKNTLSAHTTHAVPPPIDDIHFLDFSELDDHIHMLSCDDLEPEPIVSDGIYEMGGVTLGSRMPTPFRLVLEVASVQMATIEPLTFTHYSVQTSFILISDVKEPLPTTTRPLEGTFAPEEVRREDDKILSTHRDALIQALSQIRVETTTTPEGLIHMMMAGRATCIVFSNDDLPPEGSNYTFQAYDSTRREVVGTLEIELLIGPTTFITVFQKVKFIHDGQIVTVQSMGDIFIFSKPVLQISHSDNDLFLTGLTFDEVQTLEMEDFC